MSDSDLGRVVFACPACGHAWTLEGAAGGRGPYRYTMTIGEPSCPRCGNVNVDLILDSELWQKFPIRELILRMPPDERGRVAQAVQDAPPDSESLLASIASASPTAKLIFDMAKKNGLPRASLVGVLVLLVWAVHPLADDARQLATEKIETAIVEMLNS